MIHNYTHARTHTHTHTHARSLARTHTHIPHNTRPRVCVACVTHTYPTSGANTRPLPNQGWATGGPWCHLRDLSQIYRGTPPSPHCKDQPLRPLRLRDPHRAHEHHQSLGGGWDSQSRRRSGRHSHRNRPTAGTRTPGQGGPTRDQPRVRAPPKVDTCQKSPTKEQKRPTDTDIPGPAASSLLVS